MKKIIIDGQTIAALSVTVGGGFARAYEDSKMFYENGLTPIFLASEDGQTIEVTSQEFLNGEFH